MSVIDAHVHFWDPRQLHYDWHAEAPPLSRPFLPSDYAAATQNVPVEGLVFVEADCRASQALPEVAWVDSLAQDTPQIRGVVAAAPLELGPGALDHLRALQEHPLVRGVRRLIQAEGPGFCTDPSFVEAVRTLPEFDFSFDLCIKHHQFSDVRELVAACPETHFILDHIGKPDIAQERIDPWKADIEALAKLPQVVGCKLSGLITEAQWETWTSEQLAPYVTHVIEVFGTDRLLYGSDWPVSVLAGGYQKWWAAFTELTSDLDETQRTAICQANAQRVYRL